MIRKLVPSILTILILATTVSCIPANRPTPPAPESDNQTESTSQSDITRQGEAEPLAGLPFTLLIGNAQVASDLKVNIPEGKPVLINYIASDFQPGEMKVTLPDGTNIFLGSWQAEQAQFYFNFPYGENHLAITRGDESYDILVISGAPEPDSNQAACSGGFIKPDVNSVLHYEERIEGEQSSKWDYTISDVETGSDGVVSFKLAMDRRSGIENNIDRSTVLHLYCSDNILYITRAEERQDEFMWTTTYDENSVYLPADFMVGVTFERRGRIQEVSPDGEFEYDLTERLGCSGVEKVSVQAGEFLAYRVEFAIERTSADENLNSTGTSWYVPGLGRILSEGNIEGNPELELVSYEGITPGVIE